MFTFLPALILLLLHGPSTLERPLGQSGRQADIGALAPRVPSLIARNNRAWIADFLSRVPGDALLAALGITPVAEQPATRIALSVNVDIPSSDGVTLPERVGGSQRDRDGPKAA